MMGASIDSNKAEFNFKQDPESDMIVLKNTNEPSIILPVDTVYSHVFSKVIYHNIYKYICKNLNFILIFK